MRLKKWQTKFAAVMLAGAMVFGQCAWAATDDVVALAAENSTVALENQQRLSVKTAHT